MIKKPNKLIQYISIALGAVLACGVFMSSTNFSLSNVLRSRASETINGSITFINNGSNVKSYVGSTSYYFVNAKTQTGMDVYLRNATSGTLISGNVAFLTSGDEITFAGTNGTRSPEHFEFQSITSIYAKSTSTNSRTLEVRTSQDGTSYSSYDPFYVTSSGATYNFTGSGAKFIKITYSSFLEVSLNEFVINYTCTPSKTRTLESIEVETSPTKTEYTEGDYFDPTGLVITASYDDGSEDDIAYGDSPSDFTFSPSLSTALSTENASVTITYGGKSTSQEITVSEASSEFIDGTFSYGSAAKWQLTFFEDLTGYYKKYGSSGDLLATVDFKYELSDVSIRLYDVGDSYGKTPATWTTDWWLTDGTAATGRSTENDTGTYNVTNITIYTYNTSKGTRTLRTFTKI